MLSEEKLRNCSPPNKIAGASSMPGISAKKYPGENSCPNGWLSEWLALASQRMITRAQFCAEPVTRFECKTQTPW